MTTISGQWREPFPESEIPSVLSALVHCALRLRKTSEQEIENAVSDRLLALLDADDDFSRCPVEVHREVPTYRRKRKRRTAQVSGRPDFRFVYSTQERKPWPEFEVEAKRLHTTSKSGRFEDGIGEYVTTAKKKPEREQGMMCFITGRYSNGLRSGAMLGYVFNGDVAAARVSIKDAITRHRNKLKVRPVCEFRNSAIVSGITESIHDLVDEIDLNDPQCGLFTIYHILVAV